MSSVEKCLKLDGDVYVLGSDHFEFEISCSTIEMNAGYSMISPAGMKIASKLIRCQSIGKYTLTKLCDLLFIKIGQVEANPNKTLFLQLNKDKNDCRMIIISKNESLTLEDKGCLTISPYYDHCPLFYIYNCQKYLNLLMNELFVNKFFELKKERKTLDIMSVTVTERESVYDEAERCHNIRLKDQNTIIDAMEDREKMYKILLEKKAVVKSSLTNIDKIEKNMVSSILSFEREQNLINELRIIQQNVILDEQKILESLNYCLMAKLDGLSTAIEQWYKLYGDVEQRKSIENDRCVLDIEKTCFEHETLELEELANM